MTVKIVTVCTGNICRSPWAERYLQSTLDNLSPAMFQVTSGGTFALTGEPMDPLSRDELVRVGATAQDFTARQLTEHSLVGADLVLGMSTEHRDYALSLSPRLLKRSFTVREFAHLLTVLPMELERTVPRGADPATVAQRWSIVPRMVSSLRAAASVQHMDVADPYRQGPEAFSLMVQQLQPALDQLVEHEKKWRTPAQA